MHSRDPYIYTVLPAVHAEQVLHKAAEQLENYLGAEVQSGEDSHELAGCGGLLDALCAGVALHRHLDELVGSRLGSRGSVLETAGGTVLEQLLNLDFQKTHSFKIQLLSEKSQPLPGSTCT